MYSFNHKIITLKIDDLPNGVYVLSLRPDLTNVSIPSNTHPSTLSKRFVIAR